MLPSLSAQPNKMGECSCSHDRPPHRVIPEGRLDREPVKEIGVVQLEVRPSLAMEGCFVIMVMAGISGVISTSGDGATVDDAGQG